MTSALVRSQLAIAAVVVAVFALVVARSYGDDQAPGQEGGPPSTFSSASGGARALYLAAQDVGFHVDRWMRPLPDARRSPAPGTLVILGPDEPLLPSEVASLRAWVEDGGHLFYAASPGQDDPFLVALGLSQELDPQGAGHARTAQRDEVEDDDLDELLAGAAPAIPGFGSTMHVVDAAADLDPLYSTDDAHLGAARVRRGRGEAIVLSDVTPLTNRPLRTREAAVFALRALGHLSRDRVLWFDELPHGYDEDAGLMGTLLRFLLHTHRGWAVLELSLLALVATAFAGRRFGAALAPAAARGRSALEQVDALASAYEKARAVELPAERMLEWLRLRLGVASARDLEMRLSALSRSHPALAPAIARLRGRGPGAATALAPADLVPFSAAIDEVMAAAGSRAPRGNDHGDG